VYVEAVAPLMATLLFSHWNAPVPDADNTTLPPAQNVVDFPLAVIIGAGTGDTVTVAELVLEHAPFEAVTVSVTLDAPFAAVKVIAVPFAEPAIVPLAIDQV